MNNFFTTFFPIGFFLMLFLFFIHFEVKKDNDFDEKNITYKNIDVITTDVTHVDRYHKDNDDLTLIFNYTRSLITPKANNAYLKFIRDEFSTFLKFGSTWFVVQELEYRHERINVNGHNQTLFTVEFVIMHCRYASDYGEKSVLINSGQINGNVNFGIQNVDTQINQSSADQRGSVFQNQIYVSLTEQINNIKGELPDDLISELNNFANKNYADQKLQAYSILDKLTKYVGVASALIELIKTLFM